MWILSWAAKNKLAATIIVVFTLIALSSAIGGVRDWFQKRAEIQELKKNLEEVKKQNELEKSDWQKTFTAKDVEYAQILRERNNLRAKLAQIQSVQNKPWIVPATDNELLTRFKVLGY